MTLGLEGLLDELAERIAAAVVARLEPNGGSRPPAEPDHLLTLDEAARRLGVSIGWLRSHARRLPFMRKLSHRVVRFSATGIERWLAGARTGSGVLRGPEKPRPASTPRGADPGGTLRAPHCD